MWAATIDFMKAFDSITPKSIWSALKSCDIEHDYIHFLKKLYRDQNATVMTDDESDMFEIKNGTKQGDPLSSLLYNRFCRKHWNKTFHAGKRKGMGIYVSDNDHDRITNMRFADDVLLFATSKRTAPLMLCDFKRSTEKWYSESIQEDENSQQPKLEHQRRN